METKLEAHVYVAPPVEVRSRPRLSRQKINGLVDAVRRANFTHAAASWLVSAVDAELYAEDWKKAYRAKRLAEAALLQALEA